MSEGLTAETRSQAETLANDLQKLGHKVRIRALANGTFRVYFVKSTLSGVEREEEVEVAQGIRERRVFERIEKATEPSEEQEVEEEKKSSRRRLVVKKAMEETPEEIERPGLSKQ